MKVLKDEKLWRPPEATGYLTLIPKGMSAPKTVNQLIALQSMMASRLVSEARELDGAIEWAESELADLEPEILNAIPHKEMTWENPNLPVTLLKVMVNLGTPQGRALSLAVSEDQTPAERTPELLEEAEALDLATWIQNVIL